MLRSVLLSTLIIAVQVQAQVMDISLDFSSNLQYSWQTNNGTIQWGGFQYSIGPYASPSNFTIGWYASVDNNVTPADHELEQLLISGGNTYIGVHFEPGPTTTSIFGLGGLPHNVLLHCAIIVDAYNNVNETNEGNNKDNVGSFSIIVAGLEEEVVSGDGMDFELITRANGVVVRALNPIDAMEVSLFTVDGRLRLSERVPAMSAGQEHLIALVQDGSPLIWRSFDQDGHGAAGRLPWND